MSTTRRSLIIFFIITALCGSVYAAGDDISAHGSVNRSTILVGDRIKFLIDVKYRKGTQVSPPVFKDDRIGSLEIKDSGRKIKEGFFGARENIYWYSITSYELGKHTVPQVEIKYKSKGAKDPKIVKTKALAIEVVSILPKGKEFKDIKDAKGPLSYFEVSWAVVAAVIFLAVVIIVTILYIRRKRMVPVKLPHETALEELEFMRAEFLRTLDVKEYYAGVSDCIRRYIERSFKLKAPEMTTEEFLGSLRESTALSLDQKDLLKDFLNACDLVKFAKYKPARNEAESVYVAAKKFIDETKKLCLYSETR